MCAIWGNYIVSNNASKEEATINIETQINNDFKESKECELKYTIYDQQGNKVAQSSQNEIIEAENNKKVKLDITLKKPQLWDLKKPHLYTIKTVISIHQQPIYSQTDKTGIRNISFDDQKGFFLNGQNIKIKGVCLHHAGGPLGAAIHRRTIERQLEKLREMGCNAVRTAHNPFSEEFLNVCDSMGFLVMNEMFDEWEKVKEPATTQNGKKIRIPVDFYANIFHKWADKDLTDFVMRDRNHPSVIMWSIGNEIDQMRKPAGEIIGKRLAKIVHQLDYRPITNGVHGYGWGVWPDSAAAAVNDIYGYNYIKNDGLDKERQLHPNTKTIITEHESAQSFYPRGTYLYDDAKKAWWDKLAYEYNEAFEWVEKRDIRGESGMNAWKWVKERPHVMGMFIWTGWDYLGEVIPFGWPARSSSFAPIDLCGFPKDGYYFYQSQWTDKPMVHIFPHWNLDGMEGKKVTVYAFTNGEEVELFQDGKSLGKKTNNCQGVEYQSWDLIYKPGELKAVSYKNGKIHAQKTVRTAGEPAKIQVNCRRNSMKANAQDLIYVECTIIDKDGNEVPTADNMIEFEMLGPATIAGVGNSNNMSLESFKSNQHSAFNGKCLAIIQSTRISGDISLIVKSSGLPSTTIHFHSK
ncbi:glycoside hydrolase family 2 TIM barrel-domain containing protein [Saccharicrinis fermentans]|uniref:glycoside hydrolase family 2 TIM barrel-domain containing protein n=1 Tax=Saccharicrinis fermentans TaxID=982 RepID=UPI002ADE581C|nr:glycoside hydrolase family 2 TIM barrel-domain containing protein [Saccharicrinis fermentans]